MSILGISLDSPLTERQMLAYLSNGGVRLPAIDIRVRAVTLISGQSDAVIDLSWGAKTYAFAVECKTLSTPKTIDAAMGQAFRYSQATGMSPMIFIPFLGPEALERLEAASISGIDLSGNGVITVPGEMLVYKSGAPNKFPLRQKGSNPYRGASSLVARTLAIQPEFESSRALETFITEHGGTITQGAISKALHELEEDLVIQRLGRAIRVLQYDLLLDALVRHFERPDPHAMRSYKVSGSQTEIRNIIMTRAAELGEQIVVTGLGSASHYTAMAQSPPMPIYCRRLDLLEGCADPASRFPNVSIKRMTDAGAYYDARLEDGLPWASAVQTYLELMNGGARDREMADQVRRLFSPDSRTQFLQSEIDNHHA